MADKCHVPKNVQYYPNVSLQNVLNISTARESELAAIPFVANADKGIYGSHNMQLVLLDH